MSFSLSIVTMDDVTKMASHSRTYLKYDMKQYKMILMKQDDSVLLDEHRVFLRGSARNFPTRGLKYGFSPLVG